MANIKNIFRLSAASLLCLAAVACSDVKYEEPANLPTATGLTTSVSGRSVTLSWNLPAGEIAGVTIIRNADFNTAINLAGRVTNYTLRSQPMDQELTYTVKVRYADGTVSEGISVNATVPYIAPKMGYLLTASSASALPDDDERAAAEWFATQQNAEFVTVSQLSTVDPDIMPVIWIEIDREGLPMGWENLPAEFISTETLDALKAYSANGGNLYLSTFATQLTVPLGFVPDNMAPTVYGNGAGGEGSDVWVINPHLGVDFNNNSSEQGYYDRAYHEVFKGITLEDPNNYGYSTVPLIGPGHREDHNCLWDCNIYGKGSERDVIRNFEVLTNSMVLATWGHVRDHCVAGLVDFFATPNHGRCVAMGLAAYEWNQNSGNNIYQRNVEIPTANVLHYLK